MKMKNIESIDYYPLPNGRSFYNTKCPFCKNWIQIQAWSYKSTGKKCTCGAILRKGIAKIKESEEE